MNGLVIITIVLAICLFAFPKHRIHILAGSILIGLLLYFTTDRDIRDGRRADTDIRLEEIAIQNALLEWDGPQSRFIGRLRNKSRKDLAALEMHFVITACKTLESTAQIPPPPPSQDSVETAPVTTTEKQTLIHGVFYDALHAADTDIIAESQRWAQRRHPGDIVMDCKIIDKNDTSFTLPKNLPRGRERDTIIPVSFNAALPKDMDISWYWAITSAQKMKDVQEQENSVKIETEKPAAPEQP